MDNHLIPNDIRAKIQELGFHATAIVELHVLWSVIGIDQENHYNIQLLKKDLSIDSIHRLKYKWNATGAKIMDVIRVPILNKEVHEKSN